MSTTTPESTGKPHVIFLPGGVTPANLSYAPLLGALGETIHPILKELEVYAGETPPLNYGLELEVQGLQRVADSAGWEHFHLVGYSAGGAVSLAFAARFPHRLISLALLEPAWIGKVPPEDTAALAELDRFMILPPDQRMVAFMRWHMRPGVEPPAMRMPPGPPPSWMSRRPAGLEALSRAFNTYQLDQAQLRYLTGPVYYALGDLSARYFEHEAIVLAGYFPSMHVEEYAGRSHFDPPHRAEPERFARALRNLWAREG